VSYHRQYEVLSPTLCKTLLDELGGQLHFSPQVQLKASDYQMSGDSVVRDLFEPALVKLFPVFGEQGPWIYADLATIFSKGVLHLHKDGYRNWERRHVVLQTNDEAWNYHDGTWVHMPLGTVWKIDPRLPHGSLNWGKDPRIHLIFDVEL